MCSIGSIAASFAFLEGSGRGATMTEPDFQASEKQFRELPMVIHQSAYIARLAFRKDASGGGSFCKASS
jgi:hypothetical protein